MKKVLFVIDHGNGQTEKIAHFIAKKIRDPELEADVVGVRELPDDFSMNRCDEVPSFLFSVSLSAAGKSERQKANAERCMEELLQRTTWAPWRKIALAGALRYRDYNPLLRWMMRRIARKENGETDTSRNYEYTDWQRVAVFANECQEEMQAEWECELADESEEPIAVSPSSLQ